MHKLIVHIGAGKCGSSAIQEYLRVNAAALRAQGVLVPPERLAAHSALTGTHLYFFEELRANPYQPGNGPTRPDAWNILGSHLVALRDEMQRDNLHTLVLSSESIFSEEAFAPLLAQARTLFDVHVVVYIRRQDELMSSAWGQWNVKLYPSIDAYLAACMFDYDWDAKLSAWRNGFGVDRVHVRLFDRAFLHNGDVVDDFVTFTGLRTHAVQQKIGRVNESNDERLIALAHRVQDNFTSMHDMTFYRVLNEVLGSLPQAAKEKPWLFDFKRRTEIMSAYADSNERVRRVHFPQLPAPLFSLPREEDTQNPSDLGRLEREISMLTRIVYALAVRSLETEPSPPAVETNAARSPETTQSIVALALPDSQVLRNALTSEWYAARNADVTAAGFDPVDHWRRYGAQEGRMPAPDVALLVLELAKERHLAEQRA